MLLFGMWLRQTVSEAFLNTFNAMSMSLLSRELGRYTPRHSSPDTPVITCGLLKDLVCHGTKPES